MAVARLAMLDPELYDLCRRVSYATKGVPDSWMYQTGTDLIDTALCDLGFGDTSKAHMGQQSKWFMLAFMRNTPEPASLGNGTGGSGVRALRDRMDEYRKMRASRIDIEQIEARILAALESKSGTAKNYVVSRES